MSRSRKRHPVTGTTCKESEKFDKALAHRKLRQRSQQAIRNGVEDAFLLPDIHEVSQVWCFAKDGKQWYAPEDDYYEESFRK